MPNCSITGTINFTSRNFTLMVAKYNPKPKPLITVKTTNNGAKMICQCICCPEIINRTIKMIKEIKKSTKQTKMVLKGIIILGKYTFENKLELPIIELLTSLNTLENNCHNNIADATLTKLKAVFPVFVIFVDMYPNTIILMSGFIKAQAIPAKACLYRTKKSRFAKLFNKLL